MSSAQLAISSSAGSPLSLKYPFQGAAVLIALIIVTMPIRQVSVWDIGIAHARISDVLLAVCFGLWLASGCIRGRWLFPTNAFDGVVVVFLLLYTLSILWADNIEWGLYQGMKILRNGMLYILLVAFLSANFPRRYLQVAMCLLITGLLQTLAYTWSMAENGGIAALTMLVQAETVQSNNSILNVVRIDQGAGIFLRGVASWLPLCMFAGISIIPFIHKWGRVSIWLLIVVMGLMTVLSATRSAWVGLAVGLLTIGMLMVRKIRLNQLVQVVTFMAIVLVGGMSLNLHSFIQARFTSDVLWNDPAIQDRFVYFQGAFDAFHESPILGKGVGNIDQEELFFVHNAYLQVLGELGILGGATFFAVCGLWLWALFSARKRATHCGDHFGARVSVAMIGASMFFFTYFLVGHDLAGGEPWLVMGIASALLTYGRRCSKSRPEGFLSTC